MNNITLALIKTKTRKEIIDICQQFPYRSAWQNKDAYEFAVYELAFIQGNRYLQTGKINSFSKNIF